MLIPHMSEWGTCILQTWTPNFNPSRPTGLKVPTWITLKGVRRECLGIADQIAASLGEVVGGDKHNAYCTNQRFCIALVSSARYRLQVLVKNNYTGMITVIKVDFGNLPIKCRFCQSLDHLVKQCPTISENGVDTKDKRGGKGSSLMDKGDTAIVLPLASEVKSKDKLEIFKELYNPLVKGRGHNSSRNVSQDARKSTRPISPTH